MSGENTFYPNIGSLVSLDSLPEALSFLRPKLQDLLDSAYYRNLQVIESSDGSRGAYDMELIIPKELSEFELFDTGLSLVLFPGESDYSYLHVIFSYGWPALALIRNFSTDSFSYSPEAMLNLLDRSISISDTDNLSVSVRLFEGGETLSAVSSFIDKVNTEYSLPVHTDM